MSETTTVANGQVVSIHYTLKTEEGEVLDSSEGGGPLPYLHGADNIVPGLERQLAGKAVGDKLQAIVPAAEGYGERTGEGPQPVPRANFPEGAEIAAGMVFQAQSPEGEITPIWVVAVEDDEVLVDINHPLAGVTLCFDVEITGIRSATEEEQAHGHPHGLDGTETH